MLQIHRPALAAVLLAVFVSSASGLDQIKTSKANMAGTIEVMGKFEVKFKRIGDKVESIPVNDIESIRFDSEPIKLNLIRGAVQGGRYDDAIKDLNEMANQSIEREATRQDIQYFKALAMARQALAGGGDLTAAETAMSAFIKANPENYHYIDASELAGDLLVANNKHALAQQYYGYLEQAPWPDVKMRGGVAKGRALLAEKKYPEALTAYDGVLTLAEGGKGDAVELQKQAAAIGKAACLAETGKHVEGIALLEDVINKADAERADLHAAAYNALGKCQRKAGNAKAALLAYLHTDVLYNTIPAAHAEALANLVELWKEVGNNDRSAQAEVVLNERYKGAKK